MSEGVGPGAPWRPRPFADVARDAGLWFVHETWHDDRLGKGWGTRVLDAREVVALWRRKVGVGAWRSDGAAPRLWATRASAHGLRPRDAAALARALEDTEARGEAWDLGGDPWGRERHWGFADVVVVLVDEGDGSGPLLWTRGEAPRDRNAMAREATLTGGGHGDPFVGPAGPPTTPWRDRTGAATAGILDDLANLLATHRGLPRALELRLATRTRRGDDGPALLGFGTDECRVDVVSGRGEEADAYVAPPESPVGRLLDACAARIAAEGLAWRAMAGRPRWRSSGWQALPLTMVARIAPETTSTTIRAAARERRRGLCEAARGRLATWLGDDAKDAATLRDVAAEAIAGTPYEEYIDHLGMALAAVN